MLKTFRTSPRAGQASRLPAPRDVASRHWEKPDSSQAGRRLLRAFLACAGLRYPVSARRHRLHVFFGAPVSGGKNLVPNSSRAGNMVALSALPPALPACTGWFTPPLGRPATRLSDDPRCYWRSFCRDADNKKPLRQGRRGCFFSSQLTAQSPVQPPTSEEMTSPNRSQLSSLKRGI